jgi:hypothetical protein
VIAGKQAQQYLVALGLDRVLDLDQLVGVLVFSLGLVDVLVQLLHVLQQL